MPTGVNNIVVAGDFVYATAGAEGLLVYNLRTGERLNQIAPPQGSDRVDDIAQADRLLFVLDGAPPGALSVFSLAEPARPGLVSGPVEVDVSPFSGVSAAAGLVCVSGGTGRLTVHSYDTTGNLGPAVAYTDLGRGQPDVLLTPDGTMAYVSTDFASNVDGVRFGLTVLALNPPPQAPTVLRQIGIPGAGFTAGVRQPANFPIESVLVGSTLFTTYGDGIAILEAADPATTHITHTIPLDFHPVNVDAWDNELYAVGSSPNPTLAVIAIGDIDSPQVLRTINLPAPGQPTGVAVENLRIAVADVNNGVLLFDRQV